MIVKPEDADQYKCCVHDQQCLGVECMAWRKQYVFIDDERGVSVDAEDSGYGYCGIAHN
jgi:hypothetical protein